MSAFVTMVTTLHSTGRFGTRKQKQKQCDPDCTGLSEDALSQIPSNTELLHLSVNCETRMIHDLAIHLDMEETEWNDMVENYPRNTQMVKFLTLIDLRENNGITFWRFGQRLNRNEDNNAYLMYVDDRRRIEQHAGQDDQNKALLDIVSKRREPAYSVFVDGLRIHGYEDIANDLKCASEKMGPSTTSVPDEYKGKRESINTDKIKRGDQHLTLIYKVGWHCQACTFLNLPTRPGCEMCSQPRPRDYKIPDNYIMSKEELERLQRVQEDERKAQQATKERRAREIEPDENIYNEMTEQEIHQLLTLNDQMQHQILQSRQTGGQENESNGGVQIARGGMQQQENLENIQYTLQPSQHLDFSQEKDDSV
ncbi:Hypothetical predicted protein [Mytilus galloprovincialis]|uniref:RanBP2-type domain-containing protein n=1 Tax=Mytilus galloprovincialis TaxID=29158 RepID=A0A8B6FC46_MYTGA|nr:Hypothetical predicted protein [Mytilus galloprovincialis]